MTCDPCSYLRRVATISIDGREDIKDQCGGPQRFHGRDRRIVKIVLAECPRDELKVEFRECKNSLVAVRALPITATHTCKGTEIIPCRGL